MFFTRNGILAFMMVVISAPLHAGTMGPAPSFDGFSFGVGGGYVNTNSTEQSVVNMISSFPTVTEYFREEELENSFSPVVNASYLFALKDNWLLGVKGVYKYLSIRHSELPWSGTFQNGTFQRAELHKKRQQEFFFMLDAGYQLYPSWLVYLGVGPSVTGLDNELRGDLLESTASTFQFSQQTKNKNLWGGAGQVGFEYLLPHRFAVDFSYNLVVTPMGNMPTMFFNAGASGFYTSFAQRIQLLEQGLNVTVNKYFF